LVDFDEPGFGFFVEKDVDAEDLEALLMLEILWLCCSLDVSDVVMTRNNRFHCEFFELLPTVFTCNDLRITLPSQIYGLKN